MTGRKAPVHCSQKLKSQKVNEGDAYEQLKHKTYVLYTIYNKYKYNDIIIGYVLFHKHVYIRSLCTLRNKYFQTRYIDVAVHTLVYIRT